MEILRCNRKAGESARNSLETSALEEFKNKHLGFLINHTEWGKLETFWVKLTLSIVTKGFGITFNLKKAKMQTYLLIEQ